MPATCPDRRSIIEGMAASIPLEAPVMMARFTDVVYLECGRPCRPSHIFSRMKSHTTYLTFHTGERMEFINITQEVAANVKASGVREGLCLVNAMHITA